MNDKFVLQDERLLDDIETIKVFADERRPESIATDESAEYGQSRCCCAGYAAFKAVLPRQSAGRTWIACRSSSTISRAVLSKVYQVTARNLDWSILCWLATRHVGRCKCGCVRNITRRDTHWLFLRALTDRDPAEGTPPRHPFLSQKLFRLTDDQLSMLHTRLRPIDSG